MSVLMVMFALLAVCVPKVSARQVKKGEMTVRGSLARTVEAGGWVINSTSGKYLFLNAGQYQNRVGFREGAVVEAKGETKTDVMTIYQEGTPFEVRELVIITRGGAMGNGEGNQIGDSNETTSVKTQVIVSGDSIVQAQPDTAIVQIGVVTQNKSALAAQNENARKSEAVVRAVREAAGANAEVKTSGYSLQPQRVYKENQPPTIVGYEARNNVTVTLSDLNRVGAVIDAASDAGANNVDNLSFTLRRDQPAKAQALRDATMEAMAKAQTLAQALGGRVTRILQVQEEGTVRPLPFYRQETLAYSRAAADIQTPIEVGTLDITSRVQLTAEIETGR